MKKKILTIVGARPQFIKCAPVSKEIRKRFDEILIHTGQHYDENMSRMFFTELQIPDPHVNMGIGSGTHATQTGKMLVGLEKLIFNNQPDMVLIYGDTNSTIAGALAAAKLNVPVGHVEAGLRSFNRKMPEEINRIISDKISQLLFCPTPTAMETLASEGITDGVHFVGDVMYDVILKHLPVAETKSKIMQRLNLNPGEYYLATIHRAENTDVSENLKSIFLALSSLDKKVVLPLHPRTRITLKSMRDQVKISSKILLINPVSYLDILVLQKNCHKILTDSGGMQKEAYFLRKPCITLRNETEWTETIKMGVNILAGSDTNKIIDLAINFSPTFPEADYFGDGNASQKIIYLIQSYLNIRKS